MTIDEAITIFRKGVKCNKFEDCDTNCKECEFNVTHEEGAVALAMAVGALEQKRDRLTCKDCTMLRNIEEETWCAYHGFYNDPDSDYCSRGERRKG